MEWNLEGLRVHGKYMGEYACSGLVESSRVMYGGGVQHTVTLDKSLQLRWRSEPTDRVLLEHQHVVQVQQYHQT
jgi:ABC-type hemin transport system ATPase subunit